MTGPNLLAWAKENQSVGFYEASDILGQLARAILADEEERKRTEAVTKPIIADGCTAGEVTMELVTNPAEIEQLRMDWLREFNEGKKEAPTE